MISKLIRRWFMADAKPWQFWMPASGPMGGMVFGGVVSGGVIAVIEWLA